MGSDDDDHDHHSPHRLDIIHKATLATVSLVFAFTLIIILFFLCLKHRQNRRRHHQRQIDFISRLIAAHSEPHSDHPSHKNALGGLDPTVINSLPEFPYKKPEAGGGSEATDCSVCLGVVSDEAMVRMLPNCGHVFHVDCVDMWLGSHTTCPLCRTEVEPRVPMDQLPEESLVEAAQQQQPTAPPVDEISLLHGEQAQPEIKPSGSTGGSRLSSFRRMLSRERLSTRSLDGCGEVASASFHHDLERQ